MHHVPTAATMVIAGALVLTACADGLSDGPTDATDNAAGGQTDNADAAQTDDAETDSQQRYPDVIDAELESDGDLWRLSATLSSPYDTPERYADAFRALTPDGQELGVRVLLHDHADEQPFTRTLEDLEIPHDIDEVIVQGRDLEHGWGGDTVSTPVPGR